MAADERPISDFPRLTSILTTALLFTSVVTGVDSYDSRSVTTEVLARAMLGDFQYSEIDAQTVFDRINQIKVLSDTAAPSAADGAENQIFVQIDDTGSTDVIDAIFVKYSGSWLEVPYQKSSDNNLQTVDKTIVGAINELNTKTNSIYKLEVVQLFNGVSIANNTEYNSNGSTIPHASIPTKTGYTPIAIVNVQAMGYYGSRILLYAWIDTGDGKIHFSAFNTMENFQYTPTVIGYAWVMYIKNELL